MLKRYFISVFLISVFLTFSCSTTVYASTKEYGFKITDLSENEKEQIWQYINFKSSVDSVPLNDIGSSIVSFDVSDDDKLLLGFDGNKVAVVEEKTVLNFYEFTNDGSFYVQWNGRNILLLLVRGSIIVEISLDGNLVNMIKADESYSENNSLWNHISRKKCITQGENSYCVQNDIGLFNVFASSYSQLIKTASDGSTTVIYDVNSEQTVKTISEIIGIFLLVTIVLAGVVLKFTKLKKRNINISVVALY